MKYMKLGTKPDVFYTREDTRSVLSDVPPDLIIQINNTTYLLHKFPLLLKCGLLQSLCSDTNDPDQPPITIPLHDIPSGKEAFDLCAKFCYGIAIKLSAHNFIQAIAAAKFLQMTESISRGNLLTKLETFFETCIIQGWKDPIVTLQSIEKLSRWAEDPQIVQPCMDAIIEKILTHPSKVTWSHTYTRPGYDQKQHRSAPKDWWTEDVSELDLDLFRSIISAVRSTKKLPPSLIGEALHVYACKHLPDPSESIVQNSDQTQAKHRRILESIVSMIPSQQGTVSGRFMLRLLKVANHVRASPSVKAELVRRSGRQLHEAMPGDLIFPLPSNPNSYDVGLVEAILENFLVQLRRPLNQEESRRMAGAMMRVAKVFDSYLQVLASDANLPLTKFIELCESLPEIAREEHDDLYRAIDTYLKEHQELSKAERKRLCQVIDCRKLTSNVRSHAIANERLPLRKIVQLLFIEQERLGANRGLESLPSQKDPTRKLRQQSGEKQHGQIQGPKEDAWVESAVKERTGKSGLGGRNRREMAGVKEKGSGSKPRTMLTPGNAEERTK